MSDIIIDKCLLFLYCMLSLLMTETSPEFVIACLTAVALTSLNFSFADIHFPLISGPVYALLTLLYPQYSLFLPLMAYDWHTSGPTAALFVYPFTWMCAAAGILRFHRGEPTLLFLLFGLLLAVVLHMRTSKYIILHQRYQKTRDDDTELQLLLEEKNQSLRDRQDSELYAATLRERNRIAREIHDNVGHMLTRSILMVGALKIVRQEPELVQPLNQLEDTLNQAMNNIRQSVHDLHDSSINLQETLRGLIRDYSFCPVTLQYDMSPEVPREVKYSFTAIVKEALVNISRHSNASHASVTALEHPGFYQLIIQDNGTASEASSAAASDGIGLTNMESRVRALGGSIQFQKKEGFRIYITVPKNKEKL